MLQNTYRESMRNHPYGYALYEPESSNVLKPGVCGYLTDNGQWTPLVGNNLRVDLGDAESLRLNGLTSFENLARAAPDTRAWGPKTSRQVVGTRVDFTAGASAVPAGIPAEIGALYKFGTSEAFGAILMTQRPVVRESLYGDKPFKLWCRDNTRTILSKWPDVQKRGLIIVTSTYSTSRAEINAWTDRSKEITIGFRTSAVDVIEVAPSSEWYSAATESGWITAASDNPTERKVVFFGGLYFKYRKLAQILPERQTFGQKPLGRLRAGPSDVNEFKFEFAYDGSDYCTECEEVGVGEVNPTLPAQDDTDDQDSDLDF